jgi:type IV fimbrial biogenesis protein FimT
MLGIEPMRLAPTHQSGFTIFELMITLTIAGILASIAVPNVRDFMRNNRLSSTANDLLRGTQVARSEAVKRQQNVVLCASADPAAADPVCSFGAFRGWIVFQDTNSDWDRTVGETVISRHDLVDTAVRVVNDNDGIVSYGPSGFANPPSAKTPSRNVVICDSRGNAQLGTDSVARAISIDATGRSRVIKQYDKVATAITATGACS